MNQPGERGPPSIGELLTKITESPQGRLRFRTISWFIIGGGLLMLILGLASPEHPNPFLLSTLTALGVEGVVTGVAILLFLSQSRLASWAMLLSCILFPGVLYLLVRVFTSAA
jgi:uncharacterized membrane protein HdeD (DUF308 family)